MTNRRQAMAAAMNAPAQHELFAHVTGRPAGLSYWPDFITEATERQFVTGIRALPLKPFQLGAYEGTRKVVSFGFRYDHSSRSLETAEPVPEWLRELGRRIEGEQALGQGMIEHALCTEYEPGAGIGWHRDKPHFDLVFGLSLGSHCRLRFRKKAGERWMRFALNVEPRSLYLMAGEARHAWEHSIPPVEQLRYSITFRTLTGSAPQQQIDAG